MAQYATLDFGAGGEGGGGGFGGGVLPLLYSVQRGCPGSDSLKSERYIWTYLNLSFPWSITPATNTLQHLVLAH